MSPADWIGLAGFVFAAVVMLLVTQTKARVAWPAWLIPLGVLIPFALWSALTVTGHGLFGFWPLLMHSDWGLQVWFDRLISVTAAFFLLQNRARAVGMKSEGWVLAVIFTGSIGLLSMLARTVYLERRRGAGQRPE